MDSVIGFDCGFEKRRWLLKDAEEVEHCLCKIEVFFGPDDWVVVLA